MRRHDQHESGIYPMLYAFFDEIDRLDRNAMRRQVEAAVASGAHGIAVLGLGTEVGKLSADERRMLLDWADKDLDGVCREIADFC